MGGFMDKTKSFNISKALVYQAFKAVKANRGSAGVDEESIQQFAEKLEDNLYKLWNRMSSGCYFPPPVKAVEIPKTNGGKRILGIPTVSDRIAQMVVKLHIEPQIDRHFHRDSYGYRPEKSAEQALAETRRRCWEYDWLIDLDIKGFFDNMDHDLTMKALRHHVTEKWVILYVERWLKAPMAMTDGRITQRVKGTPQGGVISPLLANLFMHYAVDKWLEREYPKNPFARYADDAVIHCKTKEEAVMLLEALKKRMKECCLELNSDKTRIVYCRDSNRRDPDHINISFDFLGYTFQPRKSRSKSGKIFLNFCPAISGKAKKRIKEEIRKWNLPRRTMTDLISLARHINPQVRGWINYYGKFYRSALNEVVEYIEYKLSMWARKKYKRLKQSKEKARCWLRRIRERQQSRTLFAHWNMLVTKTT